MHCVAGLDTLTSGQVFIGDVDLAHASTTRTSPVLRRDRIGFVFQSYNLVPTLTAARTSPCPRRSPGAKPDQEWLDQVVATVGLGDRLTPPAERAVRRPAAARRRGASAGQRPEIIFADEPTGNLDSRPAREILGFMRQRCDELGQTIVMVTHDPTAAAYADRVLFLADGRIVDEMHEPTADAVLDRLKHFGD